MAGGVQVALGDAYSGERRTLVVALHIPALAEMGVGKVADVVLRYVSVGDAIADHEVSGAGGGHVVTERCGGGAARSPAGAGGK